MLYNSFPIILISPLAVEPCASNPCVNGGTCVDDVETFVCVCSFGFGGFNCAKKTLCEPNPCENGATCTTLADQTIICRCSEKFEGDRCEKCK